MWVRSGHQAGIVVTELSDPKRTSLARMRIAAQMWWARTLRRNRFHSERPHHAVG
jgi:hypothetical protein